MKSTKQTKSPAPTTTASGKKLVQSRLSFQKLTTPKSPLAAPSTKSDEARKRKLSNTGIDDVNGRAPKINRIDGKSTDTVNNSESIVASISLIDSGDEKEVMPIDTPIESKNDDTPIANEKIENVIPADGDTIAIAVDNDGSAVTSQKPSHKKKSKSKKHHKEKKLVWDDYDDANDASKSDHNPVLIKIPLPRKRKLSTKKCETVKAVKVDGEIDDSINDECKTVEKDASTDDSKIGTEIDIVDNTDTKNPIKNESIVKKDSNLNDVQLKSNKTEKTQVEVVVDKSETVKSDTTIDDSIENESNQSKDVQLKSTGEQIEKVTETVDEIVEINDDEETKEKSTAEQQNKTVNLTADNNVTNVKKDEPSLVADNKLDAKQESKQSESEESISSDDVQDNCIKSVTTPKRSAVASTSSVSTTPTGQKLTPKQLKRQKESEKKQVERQRAKEERDRKLQEEKELKQKERDEKERQRRKEKEDREEQKRREKEDRDRKRQAEIDERKKVAEQKEEERKKLAEQKEEERKKAAEQKEEERRKKDEEKQLAEEAKEKEKQKQKAAFTKFFVVKKTSEVDLTNDNDENVVQQQTNAAFMPFQVKDDMKLAPIVRRKLTESRRKEFDEMLQQCDDGKKPLLEDLYVMNLRTGVHAPERDVKTWLTDEDSSDVMIVYENQTDQLFEKCKPKQLYRAKFLKFDENRRPPYYGTWRKNSKIIKARKPFCTDKKFFDYEIDSDDEWEEEEPGESLNGSDDEKESVDDYDIDNEFFVPHGHLSDEELAKEEEGEGIDEDNSPAAQKARLHIVQKEFADEMKRKTEKIKPRLIGLIWQTKEGTKPDTCPPIIWNTLNARAMIYQGLCVLMCKPDAVATTNDSDADDNNDGVTIDSAKPIRRANITEDVVADLIRLIHGNVNNRNFLVNEFRAYLAAKTGEESNFSVVSIRKKIKELAKYGPCPEDGYNKYCWYVSQEKRKQYDVMNLTMPNIWTYVLKKSKKNPSESIQKDAAAEIVDQSQADDIVTTKTASSKNKSILPIPAAATAISANITKFTTVLTDDEKKKKFDIPDNATAVPKTIENKPKKRVNLLMSGPCGQEMSPTAKDAAVRKFLNDNNQTVENNSKTKSSNGGGIMKFATKLTDEEKRKKFEAPQSPSVKPVAKSSPESEKKPEKAKKRVNLLLSVARGEEISDATKNEAVRKFLTENKSEEKSKIKAASDTKVTEPIDDVICID